MFDSVNVIAIIGTAFFMMASATVWFSPMLFGKAWLRTLRATEEEIEATRENITKYLMTNFVLYGAALFVLAQVAQIVTALKHDVLTVSLYGAVLIVSIIGSMVLWEGKGKINFFINAGFYAYFVVVGMFMISYWPW